MSQDGLIHYRNVCQLVNVQSLEEVIKYFLKTATDRAEAATASADVSSPLPPLLCQAHARTARVDSSFLCRGNTSCDSSWMWTSSKFGVLDGNAGCDTRCGRPGTKFHTRGPHAQLRQLRAWQGTTHTHTHRRNFESMKEVPLASDWQKSNCHTQQEYKATAELVQVHWHRGC